MRNFGSARGNEKDESACILFDWSLTAGPLYCGWTMQSHVRVPCAACT